MNKHSLMILQYRYKKFSKSLWKNTLLHNQIYIKFQVFRHRVYFVHDTLQYKEEKLDQ